MDSQHREERDTLNRIESIINFRQLYYQQRDRRIELQKQLEIERIRVKKLMSHTSRTRTRYCAQCSANIQSKKQIPKDDSELISQLKEFSSKIELNKFSSLQPTLTEPSIMSKIEEHQPNKKRHVGMIQNFAVFGIKDDVIRQQLMDGAKSVKEFQGEILYSKRSVNQTEQQASKLVFPSGMMIKRCAGLKAKQKTIELMSYCYTNLKGFILNFECPDSNFKEHFHDNQLLKHVNPDHRLFCICIGIHDYTWVEEKKDKINISLGDIEGSSGTIPSGKDPKIKSQGHDGSSLSKESSQSIQDIMESLGQLEIGITQRVFCIMTYYPFFTFFQQIVRNFINIVKMQRLTVYKHNNQNIRLTIKQTDSEFQLQRMTQLFQHCLHELQYKKLNFNKEYQHKLIDQKKITLLTYWDEAKTFFVKEWIFSIMSMFTLETFLDVLTLIMLEDRVVFICQNSHILTHCIYLFTHVLFKPFNYSSPVVNIIPGMDLNFLHSPFPVVYGLLKKRKHIEESNAFEDFDFTYIFLSPEGADVYFNDSRKEILANKSTKLMNNKELKQIFRDLKKTRKKDSKSMKYELQTNDYCILANSDEKQKGVRIVSIINQFMTEEVAKKLPTQVQLENLKKKMDPAVRNQQKDEHSYLLNVIIGNFKRNCKDPFIMELLNTQTINNYLFN